MMVPGINFETAMSFALLPKLPRASHSSHACALRWRVSECDGVGITASGIACQVCSDFPWTEVIWKRGHDG